MTQFERVKSMNIEEMADFFFLSSFDACEITNSYECPAVYCNEGCHKCIRKWLESEVKE